MESASRLSVDPPAATVLAAPQRSTSNLVTLLAYGSKATRSVSVLRISPALEDEVPNKPVAFIQAQLSGFGASVAIQGRELAVGADEARKVLFYRCSVYSGCIAHPYKTPINGNFTGFGVAVSMHGTSVVVGTAAGAAILYNCTFTCKQTWIVDRPHVAGFGQAVALHRSLLAVGAFSGVTVFRCTNVPQGPTRWQLEDSDPRLCDGGETHIPRAGKWLAMAGGVLVIAPGVSTSAPTWSPTLAPSTAPSFSPSKAPTASPSVAPTASPSHSPSYAPSSSPTDAPSTAPSISPTHTPTLQPTDAGFGFVSPIDCSTTHTLQLNNSGVSLTVYALNLVSGTSQALWNLPKGDSSLLILSPACC